MWGLKQNAIRTCSTKIKLCTPHMKRLTAFTHPTSWSLQHITVFLPRPLISTLFGHDSKVNAVLAPSSRESGGREGCWPCLQRRRDGGRRSSLAVEGCPWGSVAVEGSILQWRWRVIVVTGRESQMSDVCWRAGNGRLWGSSSSWDGHQKEKSGFAGVLKGFEEADDKGMLGVKWRGDRLMYWACMRWERV